MCSAYVLAKGICAVFCVWYIALTPHFKLTSFFYIDTYMLTSYFSIRDIHHRVNSQYSWCEWTEALLGSCWFRTSGHVSRVRVDHKVWFGLLLFNGTFSTNRLYRAIGVWNISRRAGGQDKHTIEQWSNTINQSGLCGVDPFTTLGFLTGVALANHFGSTGNLTRTEHILTKTNNT